MGDAQQARRRYLRRLGAEVAQLRADLERVRCAAASLEAIEAARRLTLGERWRAHGLAWEHKRLFLEHRRIRRELAGLCGSPSPSPARE